MSWFDAFLKQVQNILTNPGNYFGYGYKNPSDIVSQGINNATTDTMFQDKDVDPISLQQQIANTGYDMTPEQEKYLDNLISRQNTDEARDWEERMRDTSLLSSGSQLEQLGLSASGVLQTGGSNVNAVGAADNVKSNVAMQKYEQRMALAKQLLSMTSQMASAGIYGHALGAAKKASSVLGSAASHSAYDVVYSRMPKWQYSKPPVEDMTEAIWGKLDD